MDPVVIKNSQVSRVLIQVGRTAQVQLKSSSNIVRIVQTNALVQGGGYADVYMTASKALSGHRAVIATGSGADYPSIANDTHGNLIIGVTLSAAENGAQVAIRTQGEVVEPTWNWTLGPVFVGDNGVLSQTLPTGAWVRRIGTAISATRLIVEPSPVIQTI